MHDPDPSQLVSMWISFSWIPIPSAYMEDSTGSISSAMTRRYYLPVKYVSWHTKGHNKYQFTKPLTIMDSPHHSMFVDHCWHSGSIELRDFLYTSISSSGRYTSTSDLSKLLLYIYQLCSVGVAGPKRVPILKCHLKISSL